MTRKEVLDLLLSKVPEDKKDAFVAELREAETKEARGDLFKKYGVILSEEERSAMKEAPANKVTDEELDLAAGAE